MSHAYAGIICPFHGAVDISKENYIQQMMDPHSRWKCPICRSISEFDDDRYEELNPEPEEE